jgi:hypothetical protein
VYRQSRCDRDPYRRGLVSPSATYNVWWMGTPGWRNTRTHAVNGFCAINNGGGRYRTYLQHPPGAPPSMSPSTIVVGSAGHSSNTPQGAAIDVSFNNGGGRCRTYRQHPHGARHLRLHQQQWWPLPDLPAASARGPAINVSIDNNGGHC